MTGVMEIVKQKLYDRCLEYIGERIYSAGEAIRIASESARDDTKSSAGDKYETGREMMQQEIDRHRRQLDESAKLQVFLRSIDPTLKAPTAQKGALVLTDQGRFYLAIGAGEIILDGEVFMLISSVSPLAQAMLNRKAGESFTFNNRQFTIQAIH